jgi:5'-3' exonuclease
LTRTLLLDADILAYQASSGNQRSYDWDGDGNKAVAADEAAARRFADEEIERIADKLKADEVIVCLSDDFSSFRKDRIDPTYKQLRNNVDRPVHLYDIKDYLAETFTTERWTALEADDVMGILATDPNRTDERIIVSADKDMQTIPGLLYRPQVGRVRRISVEEADRFHLWQTIVGDTTDGYPGLPGAGPKAAEELLAGYGWQKYQHTLKAGPRKGLEETRWRPVYFNDHPWRAIVSAYAKAGLTEADAIKQARLARILRYEDYDRGTPILWAPPAD